MTAVSLPGYFNLQILDSGGTPLESGRVYTYAPSTTTTKLAYTNSTGTVVHTYTSDGAGGEYISLNARGELPAPLFVLAGGYDITVQTASGAAVWTRRAIGTDDFASANSVQLIDLSNTSDVTKGDALVGVKRTNATTATTQHAINETRPFNAKADFGAVGNGVVDDTTALNAWLAACYSNSVAGYLPAGNYGVTSLTVTATGNRLNQSMTIFGDGRYATRLTKLSGSSPLLTVTASAPTIAPNDLNLLIKDMALFGSAKGSHGLALTSIDSFTLERLMITGFDTGIPLTSSLIGAIRDCYITDNNNGIITRQTGASAYCNNILIEGGRINYNSTRGVDIGQGSSVWLRGGVDMEGNGTAANASTGALVIRNTVDDETGFSMIGLDGVWFESNHGRTIDVESTSGLFLEIANTNIYTPESGQALRVQDARSVLIRNSFAPGTSSAFDITCDKLSVVDSFGYTITDAATSSTYINSADNGSDYISGRTGVSGTLTLTGCTTSPTGTAMWRKQGKDITLIFPDILATSNTNAATLTGLDASLRPATARVVYGIVEDNSVDAVLAIEIGTGGTITLKKYGTFTTSGSKGIRICEVKYSL